MRKLMLLSSAMLLCVAPASFAQADARPAVQINNEVTVTGCVMREIDYRTLHDAGHGGVPGSGVGVGDGFVLASAAPSMNTERGRRGGGRADRVAGRPAGESGRAAAGRSYTLAGPLVQNLAGDVGRLVQVVGTVDTSGRADAATTGAAEDLPNITIAVWHPLGDVCPASR